MKYPALRVRGVDTDLALAAVDACGPTAADDRGNAFLIFFPSAAARDAARALLAGEFSDAHLDTIDVDDEDWARRSQQGLQPVTVGRVTLLPAPPALPALPAPPGLDVLVIPASTGFGTGHHATTRLCLAALQEIDLAGKRVLDLGTGSGVLALAARALGAHEAHGVDDDPDAIRAARENLILNPAIDRVTFEVADLRALAPARADVITVNLTGALLVRAASLIASHLSPGGVLIASGLRVEERDEVVSAFHTVALVSEAAEDGWVGLVFRLAA